MSSLPTPTPWLLSPRAGTIMQTRMLSAATAIFAAAVFAVDTATQLQISVAVLYVAVVLMSVNFCGRRGVAAVATGCVALTLLSFGIVHGVHPTLMAVARCLVSLSAIGITTFLALRGQAATMALEGQAQLLDLTHDAIFVRDMNDVITYWNRGAEEFYGWSQEEALGRRSEELLKKRLPAPREAILGQLLPAGRWEGQFVHKRRDGAEVTVSSRWSLQRDERGHPTAVLETNTDITERQRAEEKLRGAESELRATINSIPTLVWSAFPDGAADFHNERWADSGFSIDALRANRFDLIHPDDLRELQPKWASALADGTPYEGEARLRKIDGSYRWFLNRAVPLRDDSGRIVKWYATSTDIEDRRQAEDALRRAKEQLTDAQRLAQMGNFSVKIGSGAITCSAEAARIFGFQSEIGLSVDKTMEHCHPDDVDLVRSSLRRVLAGAKRLDYSHRLLTPEGTVKYVHVLGHRILDEAGEPEIVGALQDITESRRAQENLAKALAELAHVTRVATLGELTASIAHEVNQPLAGIVTNGEAGLRWLAREDLGEVKSAMERMIGDGRRASEIIRRLRALAKKADMQQVELDLNDVIDDTIPLVQREVSSQRVSLRLDLEKPLPVVLGDRVQLQQVIINFIINAIQAMAAVAGRPREIVVQTRRGEADQVIVAVQDSGPGVDPETQNNLFNAFFTTKPGGMGMGLSICRSIVEAHGGRVWASRNAEAGATFQFSLHSRQQADRSAGDGRPRTLS